MRAPSLLRSAETSTDCGRQTDKSRERAGIRELIFGRVFESEGTAREFAAFRNPVTYVLFDFAPCKAEG